jgi:hypothetical protein
MSDQQLHEKIGELRAGVTAAHKRIDDINNRITQQLESIDSDLKALNEHMNKGKGSVAVILFLAGVAGGGVAKLLGSIFNGN